MIAGSGIAIPFIAIYVCSFIYLFIKRSDDDT